MESDPVSNDRGRDTQTPGTSPAHDVKVVTRPDGSVVDMSESGLRSRLSDEQFVVTQHAGTELAFTGAFWDLTEPGTYSCVVCQTPLFSADTKFDAGCGWPSFWQSLDKSLVTFIEDFSHGMHRTEVLCANCGAHLGHVFPDGPPPTGDRFCMNSASLSFLPD